MQLTPGQAYYQKNKEAAKARAKKWKEANPEKVRESQRRAVQKSRSLESREEKKQRHLKDKYNLTLETYSQMYEKQKGCCAICNRTMLFQGVLDERKLTANVDHNHTTGEIRGLLCTSCNRGLGFFKDQATLLEKAAEYLNAFNK